MAHRQEKMLRFAEAERLSRVASTLPPGSEERIAMEDQGQFQRKKAGLIRELLHC